MKHSLSAAASLGGPIIEQVKPHVEACNACADAMEAAGIGTHPTKGHVQALRHVAAHLAASAVSGRLPHVYREHDYLEDARVEAATESQRIAAAAVRLQAARAEYPKLEALEQAIGIDASAPHARPVEEIDELLEANREAVDEVMFKAGIQDRQKFVAKIWLSAAGLIGRSRSHV